MKLKTLLNRKKGMISFQNSNRRSIMLGNKSMALNNK